MLLSVRTELIDNTLYRSSFSFWKQSLHENPGSSTACSNENKGNDLACAFLSDEKKDLRYSVVRHPVDCGCQTIAYSSEVKRIYLRVDCPRNRSQTDTEEDKVEKNSDKTDPFARA